VALYLYNTRTRKYLASISVSCVTSFRFSLFGTIVNVIVTGIKCLSRLVIIAIKETLTITRLLVQRSNMEFNHNHIYFCFEQNKVNTEQCIDIRKIWPNE